MKRITIILLAVLLFSGCSNDTPATTTPSNIFYPSVVLNHISYSDYNEYLTYISGEENQLPDIFVPYPSLSFLGDFAEFSYTSSYSSAYYSYALHEANGIQIKVIHRFKEDIDDHKASFTLEEKPFENMVDLTRHPSGDACYVTIYGIQYRYNLDGNLKQLTWFNDKQWDMTFTFPENFSLETCQNSILIQLFNADTAQSAAEKLLSIGTET